MKTRSAHNTAFTHTKIKKSHKYDPYMSDHSDISGDASTQGSPSFKLQKSFRKRNRKTDSQVHLLKSEYKLSSYWTKDKVIDLVKKTGLTENQVYKWRWDYKKKIRQEAINEKKINLICDEAIVPSMMEYDIFLIQKMYRTQINTCNMMSPSRFLISPCKI